MNSYRLPLHRRYLPLERELDAADAIFYLARKHPTNFDLTPALLSTLIKGRRDHPSIRRQFAAIRRWAEQEGMIILQADRYDQQRGGGKVYTYTVGDIGADTIDKPCGYIERGWIHTLEGIDVRWLLNFLLSFPVASKNANTLKQHFARVINAGREKQRQEALRPSRIKAAFTQLLDHRLITLNDGMIDLRPLRARLQEAPSQLAPRRPAHAPLIHSYPAKAHLHLSGARNPCIARTRFGFATALYLEDQAPVSAHLTCIPSFWGEGEANCRIALIYPRGMQTLWEAGVTLLPQLDTPLRWDLTRVFQGATVVIESFHEFLVQVSATPFAGQLKFRFVLTIDYAIPPA